MVVFSARAIDKVKEYAEQMPEAEGKTLRLFIQGVGCGGFSYGFTFDEHREGDTVVADGDLEVLIDQHSAPACSLEGIPYAYRFDADVISNINSGDLVELRRTGDEISLHVKMRFMK